jgi:S-adenosylmethionine:tRNA ribosyltransferase-isomerase
LKRSDFSYALPEHLIASEPLAERSDSRLLVISPTDAVAHRRVADLPDYLRAGDVVVVNNTRVFPARLFGQKASGVMIERLMGDTSCRAYVKASKSPKEGSLLQMDGGFSLTVTGRAGDLFVLESESTVNILAMAEAYGHVPLPPYIKREDTRADRERYQTVFAKDAGAVAAPTAGLHFDEGLIDRIKASGIQWCEITLHVGAGTFNPVRVDDVAEHQMHSEWFRITPEVADAINNARAAGGRVFAIGTTSMRCLEGAMAQSETGQLGARTGETDIFITPGYTFQIVDVLFTNFHLPESTLLMLVSAFGGYERMLAAYQEAVQSEYRFFSYGDASLIFKDPEEPMRAR